MTPETCWPMGTLLRMNRPMLWIVRGALVWGRWASHHRRIARLVYIGEYGALFGLYWILFGLWPAVIVVAVSFALLNLLMARARATRRKRGLPPLPPLWHDKPS
jgi:hypothetical protein